MNDMNASVLVVDDDPAVGKVLAGLLGQRKLRASHVLSGEAALEALAREPRDLVITDLRMPGMDGLELLRRVRALAPELPVIVLTAHGSIATAVEAMRAGAADFLSKPFDREEIFYTVDKALALGARRAEAPPEPTPASPSSTKLGSCPAMQDVEARIERAARATANALVRGESGTGKELVARAIHERGPNASGPFVAVNCAALPEQLLESELFGYEKGAFTGAVGRRPGRVELAKGGTLFLDEIAEVPLAAQAKLLRLLQEREYQPLGGTRALRAEARFVAATHRDLEAMVRAGQFREDLYYRLNVLPIWLPPLRERGSDLLELAERCVARFGEENGRPGARLDPSAKARIVTHDWPGNVRELLCVMERIVVFADDDAIGAAQVSRELDRMRAPTLGGAAPNAEAAAPSSGRATSNEADPASSLQARRDEAEREAVLEALRRAGQNRTRAARLLGVSRRTLYNRLESLGIAEA
jgi:DNA-binding NtrC family response regulator